MEINTVNGIQYYAMIKAGTARLKKKKQIVNDLNVFPIPDGDTGDNMLFTLEGGLQIDNKEDKSIGIISEKTAKGMLLGARGNSGVILSQFFYGLGKGLAGVEKATVKEMEQAFLCGKETAYSAVLRPTEGTILTVIREATEETIRDQTSDILTFLDLWIAHAKASLERTPDLLPVLKEAGVVDSGAKGLIYIVEGFYSYLSGDQIEEINDTVTKKNQIDIDTFTEDSLLEFGYCTEFLLRLQNIKTDVKAFNVKVISDYLSTVGNSIVAVKTDTIVKVHVHTMEPYKVLQFCQQFGEFLTIKIENMMLQHNEIIRKEEKKKDHSAIAIVAVSSGEGISQKFLEMGVSVIIPGGQSMNPSTDDFLKAFDKANADTIFVLPNNSNVILSAEQAGKLYQNGTISVIPTKNYGDAFAVLSMIDPTEKNSDILRETMLTSMQGVKTAEITQAIRNACIGNVTVKKGDYLSLSGKEILSTSDSLYETMLQCAENMNPDEHDVMLLIEGINGNESLTDKFTEEMQEKHPMLEIIPLKGGQEIYHYIIVAE